MVDYKVKGDVIKNYVKEHGISAYQFCKQFKIGVKTYDKIVSGEKVGLTTLFSLARKMNVSLYDFLEEN